MSRAYNPTLNLWVYRAGVEIEYPIPAGRVANGETDEAARVLAECLAEQLAIFREEYSV